MLPGLAPLGPIESAVAIFAGGLCLGSFASAMAYRLPRDIKIGGTSRSCCTHCLHPLSILDLVPFFSWLFLRGKCRYCRTTIGWQYPVIELATAFLCLAFYFVFDFSLASIPMLFLAPVIVAITDIDFRHKIIPDGLNLSILLLGIASLAGYAVEADGGFEFFLSEGGASLGAAFLYGLGFYLLRAVMMAVLKKDPMGWGDIKFFAAAGFWLGARGDVLALVMLMAGLSGIFLALGWKRVTGEEEFPFGPSLLLGFTVALMCYGPVFWV